MKRLQDKEFTAAVRAHVEANGPAYAKKIEDALRAEGIATSSRRVIDSANSRRSGMFVESRGRFRKVHLKESSVNGRAVTEEFRGAEGVEVSTPIACPVASVSRMAEFGKAIVLAFGSLPPGCKAIVTFELNEEMPSR